MMPKEGEGLRKKAVREKGSWGGAREGAGRKKTSPFVSHLKRPKIEGRKFPVLITLRLRSGLPSLKDRQFFDSFYQASLRARRFGLRIIEYRILDKSLKLVCEFKDRVQLEKSFKSLNTALAIMIKKRYQQMSGRIHLGPVFLGRYMLETIEDPRAYRRILKELLLDDPDAATPDPIIGLYSSSPLFSQWRALLSDCPPEKIRFLRSSGHSDADLLTHVEDQQKIRALTASPQFWFTKNALRKL